MHSGSGAPSSQVGAMGDDDETTPELLAEAKRFGVGVKKHSGKVFADVGGLYRPIDEQLYRRGPAIPEYVWLRNTATDELTSVHRTDAKEILSLPGTIYERAEEPEGA